MKNGLSFVLEQLLSNALKYTENGSVHIYKKGQILVVEDTGIGIREEDLPRILNADLPAIMAEMIRNRQASDFIYANR